MAGIRTELRDSDSGAQRSILAFALLRAPFVSFALKSFAVPVRGRLPIFRDEPFFKKRNDASS